MSAHEERFRIPGGSLDLDFDDDHEIGTAQEPQTQVQSQVAHLTPADLSRVLSWISHPLAARTAEYFLALNISGTAFRNLDLSALIILANHDSTMAQQLARIQSGMLPCAPAPAGIQDRASQSNDSVLLAPEGESSPSDPSYPSAQAMSTSTECDEALPARPQKPSLSPPTSSVLPPAPSSAGTPIPPPSNEGTAGGDAKESPLLAAGNTSRTEVSAEAQSTDDIEESFDAVQGQGETQIRVADATADDGLAVHPLVRESPEQTTPAGEDQASDTSHLTLSTPQRPSKMETPERPSTTAISTVARDCSASISDGTQFIAISGGSELKSSETRAGETWVGTSGNRDAAIDNPDSRAMADKSGASSNLVAASVQTEFVSGTHDVAAMAAGGAPRSPSKAPASQAQIGIAGNPEAITAYPVDLAAGEDAISLDPVSTEAPSILNTETPASFTPHQSDPETPESSTSPSCSILDTPPAASSASRSDHVDVSSRLDIDLLQFSPFSFSAKLAHDERMSLSAALFKDDMDTSPESRSSESEIESAGDKSAEGTGVNTQQPNPDFLLRGCTSPPFSLPAESHAFGGEGTTLLFDNNSYRGDGSPVLPASAAGVLVTEFGHNEANQSGSCSDPYVYPPASKAVDFLRSPTEVINNCGGRAPQNLNASTSVPPPAASRPEAASCADLTLSRSPTSQAQLAADTTMSCILNAKNIEDTDENKNSKDRGADDPQTSTSPGRHEVRPPLLSLSIPISATSFREELSQLSPLFSSIGGEERANQTPQSSAVERLFSERSFSVSRTLKTPVKLKRSIRMQHVARHSRGTDTSDLALPSAETKRVFVDISVQTEQDVEGDTLRRRIKALERELRSLRAVLRRSEERAREPKPRSFWKKVQSPDPDRAVPQPESGTFGFSKDMSWKFSGSALENSRTATGS